MALEGYYRVASGMTVRHKGESWSGGQRIPAGHEAVKENTWKLVPDKQDPPRRSASRTQANRKRPSFLPPAIDVDQAPTSEVGTDEG